MAAGLLEALGSARKEESRRGLSTQHPCQFSSNIGSGGRGRGGGESFKSLDGNQLENQKSLVRHPGLWEALGDGRYREGGLQESLPLPLLLQDGSALPLLYC